MVADYLPSSDCGPAASCLLLRPLCTLESWHLIVPSAPPEANMAVLSGKIELTLQP